MGVLDELAREYEETKARGPASGESVAGGSTGRPGSSAPPGAQELLDVDEHYQALAAVDRLATFVVRLLIEEVPGIGAVSDGTAWRLRLAGEWIEDLAALPDERQAAEVLDDARRCLRELRRLARRGVTRVRTDSPCLHITCSGSYEYVPDGPDASEDLVCSRCRDRVPRAKWQRWGARSDWVTVERAMAILGVATRHAVWSRAKREGWRRRGAGREVRYWRNDVARRVEGSAA